MVAYGRRFDAYLLQAKSIQQMAREFNDYLLWSV